MYMIPSFLLGVVLTIIVMDFFYGRVLKRACAKSFSNGFMEGLFVGKNNTIGGEDDLLQQLYETDCER